MGTYWDEKEHASNATDDDAVAEVMDDLDSTIENVQAEVDDLELEADVERRLEVASLYKLLLGDSFFSVDTEASRVVTKRLRKFVREELESLLGMRAPRQEVAQLPFSADQLDALRRVRPDQIDALCRIADKVLQKDGVTVPQVAPTLKSRGALEPVKQQGLAKKAEPPAPAVRKVQAPQTAAPAVKAPIKKTPPATPPTARRVRQAKTVEVTGPNTPDAQKVFRKENIDANGRVVHEYVDAQDQSLGKKDATPQLRPPDAIPMPSPQAMFAITQQSAMQSLAAAGEDSQTISDLVLKQG